MRKRIVSLLMVMTIILSFVCCVSSEDNLVKSDVEAYQGIFMKNDIFISLPLYGYVEPNEPIGIVYQISRPYKSNNSVNQDTIKTLGDIYKESNNIYYIENNDFKMSLCYKKGKIVLKNITGASAYEGEYIQVSNAGANMSPNDVWLDIPENSDYTPSSTDTGNGNDNTPTTQPQVSDSKTLLRKLSSGESTGTITVKSSDLSIYMNGTKVNFPDARPFIDSAGRTQIPIRFIADELGFNVDWYGGYTKSVSITSGGGVREIFLDIGSNKLNITGAINFKYFEKNITMDTSAMIKNDRTYIPLRYVAEALEFEVVWQ